MAATQKLRLLLDLAMTALLLPLMAYSLITLRTAFVFFDFEEPLALFFLDYLAVMGLFAIIGLDKSQRRNGQNFRFRHFRIFL